MSMRNRENFASLRFCVSIVLPTFLVLGMGAGISMFAIWYSYVSSILVRLHTNMKRTIDFLQHMRAHFPEDDLSLLKSVRVLVTFTATVFGSL